MGLVKVYKALIRLASGALDIYIIPLLMSMSEAFSVLLYFNKTLLHKSSQVIEPGPWSQS